MENTKELIDNYFSGRLVLPEFLQNRDPLSEQVIKVFRELILCPLPKLTPEGHRVVIIKLVEICRINRLSMKSYDSF